MSRGTSVWYVLTTCLSVTMVAALVAKKWKSSILFLTMQTNAAADTFPSPCSCFSLRSSYLRDVHPTQLVCPHIAVVMWCMNTCIVNNKMSAKSGRNMLTLAAPSRMTTCMTGVGELSCTGTRSSKQPTRSESTSRSSDAATSRALLYNITRHWILHLASYAIMSLAF